MNTWFAIHRSPEAAALLRDHPNAMLLLLQILHRARWQKKKCPKTGLEHGQAYIGDWQSAGLPSDWAYRAAKTILQQHGACRFETTKLTTKQITELGTKQKANRGTIATVLESTICSLVIPMEHEANHGASHGAKRGASHGAGGPSATSNVQGSTKDSTSPAPALPEEAAFWNTFPNLPRVLSFGPKRRAALKRMQALSDWADHWQEAIERLAASKFATGGGNTGWKADIDFLLTESGFERTLAGRYDDRKPATKTGTVSAHAFSLNTPSSAHEFRI